MIPVSNLACIYYFKTFMNCVNFMKDTTSVLALKVILFIWIY